MSQANYSIKLLWKPFKTYLPDLEMWLKAHAGLSYCGNSADNEGFTCWFKEKPDHNVELAIEGYWASMTEAVEKSKIDHAHKLDKAEAYARENLPYLDMAQMSIAEKKIWMNRPLSLQDREDLSEKYPSV